MRYTHTLIFFILYCCLPAQQPADELFAAGRYASACPLYREQLKRSPNAMLHYKTGACYLYSRSQKVLSLPFLEKAAAARTNGDRSIPDSVYRLLGDAYRLNHQFDMAIQAYEQYKQTLGSPKKAKPQLQEADRNIMICEFAREVSVINMPTPFNVAGNKQQGVPAQYSCALSTDKTTMIHTFIVPVDVKSMPDGRYFEFMTIPDTTPPKQTVGKSKIIKKNQADTVVYSTTVGASVDGQIVVNYKNDGGEANLYVSRLQNNQWTKPEQIKKPMNSAGWESAESISPDGSTMYFVSDRPGGYGGKDIYLCKKMDGNRWSKAMNAGPQINSKYDDEAPFIHPNGQILYYSSNRIIPFNYDIFSSRLSGNTWDPPVNVGFPVNRNDHDIYQVTADKKKLPAAKQPSIEPLTVKDSVADQQIQKNFLVSVIDPNKTPLTLLTGQLTDVSAKPVTEATITITNNNNGQTLGVYRTSRRTGQYAIALAPGIDHNVRFESDSMLFLSLNIPMNKDRQYHDLQPELIMPSLSKGSAVTLNNVFYETDQAVPTPSSKTELDYLAQFLLAYPDLSVEVRDCIYSDENKKVNRRLAEARANEVIKYLVEEGIDEKRLTARGACEKSSSRKKEKGPKRDQLLSILIKKATQSD